MVKIIPTSRLVLLFALALPLALLPIFFPQSGVYLWLTSVLAIWAFSFYSAFELYRGALETRLECSPPEHLYVEAEDILEVQLFLAHEFFMGEACLRWEGPLTEEERVISFSQTAQPKLQFRLRPFKRGVFEIQGVSLRLREARSLWEVEYFLPIQAEGTILPDIRGVGQFALHFKLQQEFQLGLKVQRFRGQGSEFNSLREYVPGMDIRKLDWKASARRVKLVAREYQIERNHDVILLLDCGHLMASTFEGLTKLDYAINALLRVAYVAMSTGDRVGFLAFDRQVLHHIQPQKKLSTVQIMAERCAELSYSFVPTNFVVAFEYLLQHQKKRSLIIVFTDFVDRVSSQLLQEYLAIASRTHLVLFVAIRDPYLDEFVQEGASDLLEMHCQVACHALREERRLLFRDLKRLGIFCLDLPPSHISVPVLEQYLRIRARELL